MLVFLYDTTHEFSFLLVLVYLRLLSLNVLLEGGHVVLISFLLVVNSGEQLGGCCLEMF